MEQTVEKIMADVLRKSEADITDDLTMIDIEGWDSLKHMDLVLSLEHAFSIELTIDEIIIMNSVIAIKNVLENKGVL